MRKSLLVAVLGILAAGAVVGGAAVAGEHRHERGWERDHDRDDDRDRDRGPPHPDPLPRYAGEREKGGRAAGEGENRVYAKECGSCHLAFPPRLLPAASWTRMMGELERHFGQDAELEPEVRVQLERWLVERAGRPPRTGDPAPLRITERSWFRKEHRKAAAQAAGRPSIRSLANCAACHPGAERWDFEEDRVKIPVG